jgi:uncharacterized membrane protein
MTFSSEVITILDELAKRFGIAIDWTAENVIPYVTDLGSRFVTYTLVMTIISLFIKFAILFIGFFIFYKAFKWSEQLAKENKSDDEAPFFLGLVGLGIAIVGLIALIVSGWSNIETIVACNYIPETVIIDYLKTLL